MAGALVQSTNIGVYRKSHNTKQRGVANRILCTNSSVQMRGGLRISAPSLSIAGGGGGGGNFNGVDNCYFQAKVATSTPAPRERGGRYVARASPIERWVKWLKLTEEKAARMGYNYYRTDQILLELLAEGSTGIAATVLKSMGINLKDAQEEVENIIGPGYSLEPVEMPLSSLYVLEYADVEARKLGYDHIGSEHLLLGLLRDRGCLAVRVLENLGADPKKIRTQVIQMIGRSTEAA